MLCLKCGQEYEGSECPRCSGPKIVVNQNDYLKRRKAFEEEQANKSASSDNQQNDKDDVQNAAESVTPEIESREEEVLKKLREQKERIAGAAAKKGSSALKNRKRAKQGKQASNMDKAHKNGGVPQETAKQISQTRKRKSHTKQILIAVAAFVVVVAAAFGIYNLAIRKDYEMYMSSNGKIYNVSKLESAYVCEEKDAVFQANAKSFYTVSYPEELNSGEMIDSLASNNGKYFAAVMYDQREIVNGVDNSTYRIYLWNDSSCVLIAEGRKVKDVKYVTDSGKVIYTDTDVVNIEGGLGSFELLEYTSSVDKSGAITGTLQMIESQLQKFCFYTEKDLIICLNKSNSLYTYDYEKMSGKTGIADDVGYMYAMSENTDYLYTSRAGEINQSKNAAAVMYSISGRCYYHVLNGKASQTDIQLINGAASDTSIIYENGGDDLYVIGSAKISYAKIKDDVIGEISQVDSLGVMLDYEYIASEREILYISAEGKLSYISKGSFKVIAENVLDGSLCSVRNTAKGFAYIRAGERCYRSSRSAEDVYLMDTSENVSMEEVILYKNKLYYYDNSEKLLSCTIKGKDYNEVGSVEKFWLGTETK